MNQGTKDGLVLEVTHSPSLSYQDGLVLEVIHTVIPPDEDGPIITLNGNNPEIIEQNSTWNDPGATALDAVDGVVSVSIFPEYIDTSIIGPETISYIASDNAGNETTITRELIITEPEPFDKGDKPPLLESNFIINTHKLVNHESATSLRRAIPFVGSSKISSNIRKSESIYAREDRDIREVKEGIKLKDRQPEIYKLKHSLTEATINSKHTKVKLQEVIRNKDRKIIYHDIKASLSFSEAILTQISNKLEELSYLTKTTAIKTAIKTELAGIEVDPPSGSPSTEDQVATIVSAT